MSWIPSQSPLSQPSRSLSWPTRTPGVRRSTRARSEVTGPRNARRLLQVGRRSTGATTSTTPIARRRTATTPSSDAPPAPARPGTWSAASSGRRERMPENAPPPTPPRGGSAPLPTRGGAPRSVRVHRDGRAGPDGSRRVTASMAPWGGGGRALREWRDAARTGIRLAPRLSPSGHPASCQLRRTEHVPGVQRGDS